MAVGGALGAAARYGAGVAWPHATDGFPWATLAVNVTGCLAIGVLAGLAPRHRLAMPFLGTGVLGGFTTYSTYAVDAWTLADAGRPLAALAYVFGTLAAALVAVWAGHRLLRRPA
ncbi:fluoride efflux transporter CrcB [Phytohabitans kaempferiae]|uniref:Fluoride-specific ion channel FluC n=1 Tax=Phytohabitans kaempferiae TaxID=1620943 RepID=A0ABV6MEH7_9ACTN